MSKRIIIIQDMIKRQLGKVLILLTVLVAAEGRYTQSLKWWTFTIENDTRVYNAVIPSTLSTDLISNGLIMDPPYYRDVFLRFYDYETKEAQYKTNFTVSKDQLTSHHQYLIFEGLDTHAQVHLNGQLILQAHNMFRTFQVQVKFQEINQLSVKFTSSVKYDLQEEAKFKAEMNFSLPQNYSFSRKAAYQYGWDWGPRILTVGIWKDVNVLIYNDTKIKDLRLTHEAIKKDSADVVGEVSALLCDLSVQADYLVRMRLSKRQTNETIVKGEVRVSKSQSKLVSFTFSKPLAKDMIWWTWDLGSPNLLDVVWMVENQQTNQVVRGQMTTGIRTIRVVQQKTTFPTSSFYFNLNGYDIYMRGGNYIPPEMSMAKTNSSTYDQVVKDSIFARFNMIRLWGGGQFQKDEFYSAMDQAGILIWHDLMFACAMYPSNQHIKLNIEQEMRDNVVRIRHHPSIALWNGNNEVWIGWKEWGWQSGLTQSQKDAAQSMYKQIFQEVLPKVLNEEHPEVYYWQTSPSVSSNTVETIKEGDIHFWRVWGGGAAIEEYQSFIGRFNSQYGMQSMPEISSIEQFTFAMDREINSYILRLHQRHISGDKYLPMYTSNYSGTTTNLTRYAYYSQIMQAYALQMAIVSLRLNKPFNMGSLYWQLNDVWPVSSWATVDYYGMYKAAHYRIRQVYEELMIHTLHDTSSGDYIVYIVNQQNTTHYCRCSISVQLFTGEDTQYNFTIQRTVPPFQRVMVRRLPKEQFQLFAGKGYIKTQLKTTDKIESQHSYFFVSMKDRPNYVPNLSYRIQSTKMIVSTDKLASYIWIFRRRLDDHIPLKLSENYFTLTANQQRTIQVGQVPASQLYLTCYEWQANADKQQQKLQTDLKQQ